MGWCLWFVLAVSLFGAEGGAANAAHAILAAKCGMCHSGAAPQGNLSLESRDAALRVLSPGQPDASLLLARVTGKNGLALMPPSGVPLSEAEVASLRQWIVEGAAWPAAASRNESRSWKAPIRLSKPALPELSGTANPLDAILNAYWKRNGIQQPPAQVSDVHFARRAYFDIWGVPPTPEDLDRFVASNDLDKRAALIRELLADEARYTDHWISFWNDLLRNDIGVVYHGDRKPITGWLQQVLQSNLPYDAMLRDLLHPNVKKKGPDGFLTGVNWRGDSNASQTPFMQASQNTAQVFLGVNLKCASCHDSFINQYKLSHAYGLAAFFSPSSGLELVRCDMKTGRLQKAVFLYPEVSKGKTVGGSLEKRRKAAAKFFTSDRNGRMPRTIVNRYWRQLMGRGIVEPVDEMDNEPWSAELLDWLSWDLREHKYNLKHLIERIMTSTAYSLPTAEPGAVFLGPAPRRLTAEQFIDTASMVTGEWRTAVNGATASYVRDWKLKSSPLTRAMGRPIRDQVYTTRDARATTFQGLELANGSTLADLLRRGALRLRGELPPVPVNAFDSKNMRKGAVDFDLGIADLEKLWVVAEDMGSYDPERSVVGWSNIELVKASGEALPLEKAFPEFRERPMVVDKRVKLHSQRLLLGSTTVLELEGRGFKRIRGQFVIDDSAKQSDINVTARFFLFREAPDRERLVRVAGKTPLAVPTPTKQDLVRFLFRSILSREPNHAELRVVKADHAEGVEDLLWSLLMHPEFQYLP